MFGIGFGELLLVLLVAIIFINPKDLPKIAHALGTWYSKIKLIYNDIKTIKDKTMNIIENEIYSDEDVDDSSNAKRDNDKINKVE